MLNIFGALAQIFTKRGLLNDREIARLCRGNDGMIVPFLDRLENKISMNGVMRKVPSFGLSSTGYDIRLSNKFMVFDYSGAGLIDPLAFDPKILRSVEGSSCIIPPNSYVLAATVEKFNMPENVTANCIGKSTLARCGLILNVTPLEPGWSGYLTLEISNATPLPAIIYAGTGIGQIQFVRHSTPRRNYKNRESPGKYQNQKAGPVQAKN